MAKARPDIILYAINFVLVLLVSSLVAALYWFCWSNETSLDIGIRRIGFGGQKYLGIEPARYLASELEAVLSTTLILISPAVAAVSAFTIKHDYEILWWLKRSPTSARSRAYGFLLLVIGSYCLLSASSTISMLVSDSLGLVNETRRFLAVAATTTLFFSLISCLVVLGIVGFINSFEKAKIERNRAK
jgi:hypothetical protein